MSLEFDTRPMYDRVFGSELLDTATRERKVIIQENNQGRSLASTVNTYTIEFDGKNRMFYLPEASIEVKLAHDGLQTTAEEAKLIFNLFPFFLRGTFEINGSRLEDISDEQIASSIRALTENTRLYNETVLSQGFSTDSTASARKIIKFAGQTVHIPLQSLFASIKHIPLLYGCKVKLEFTRNSFNDMLTSYASPDGDSPVTSIYLSDIRLHVPVYVPNDVQRAEFESRLVGEKAFEREFYYEMAWTRQGNPVTAANHQETITCACGTPVRIYLAPVPTAADGALAGERTKFIPGAGSYFTRVNLSVDNTRILQHDLINVGQLDCSDFYRQYIDHMRKQDNLMGVPLTYEEFRNTYQILSFDLQHQDQTLFDTARSHDITLDVTSVHSANYRIYTLVILRAKAKLIGANSQVYIVK